LCKQGKEHKKHKRHKNSQPSLRDGIPA
jgi:hypothetical protein